MNTDKTDKTGKNVICSAYFPKTDTHALVQAENGCVYLYLYIRPDGPETEIRASWVRNYLPAVDSVDKKAMASGLQPRMPLRACRHPQGAPELKKEDLRLVFLEDGDGAALYEKDSLLAVIPGWASSGEFTGYARDAVGTSPFAWELGERRENDIYARVEAADAYWKQMQANSAWERFRDGHLSDIERVYGKHSEYLAVDNGYFPPRAVVTVEKEGAVFLFTLGMSLLQQPSVDLYSQNPSSLRRAELAFGIRKDIFEKHRDSFIAYLAGLSDIPWNYTTFLGDGHTVLFDIDPFGKEFSNALLLEGESHFGQDLYGPFRGDPVNTLWIVPVTSEEQHYAEDMGNDALIKCAAENVRSDSFRIFDGRDKFSLPASSSKSQGKK